MRETIMTEHTTDFSRRALGGLAFAGAVAAATPAFAQRGMGSLTAGSWMDQVKAQHRAIDALFVQLKSSRAGPQRTALLKRLADTLTAHSVAEEVVLYPAIAIEGDVPKSDELYIEQSHAKVMLNELDRLPKTGREFLPKLMALETAIKEHVADEEGNAYPKLMRQASAAENAKMSADFRMHYNKHIV